MLSILASWQLTAAIVVIVLLTPTIVSNPQEANDLTDEYGKRFRALEPLNTPRSK